MSDHLQTICNRKREDLRLWKAQWSEEALCKKAAQAASPRGFRRALEARMAAGEPALIAEIKKASPSAGLIRPDFDPPALASAYEEGGATCLSVLTDKPYFQGDNAFIAQVKEAVALPVLRKDFMLDPWQVVESRALGADCILLIMAALEDGAAAEMAAAAGEWGLDVLVEVHDAEELERALRLGASFIGVNNRNLKTLTTDLAVAETLVHQVPAGVMLVGESGIRCHNDLTRLRQAGIHAFLVGESLMRQENVRNATCALLGRNRA